MASYSTPRIQSYRAGGAIAKGKAVKIGADREHVVVCAATTDKAIGIAQNAVTTAEDLVEVALPGGGGLALAQTTVAAGKHVVSHTDGALKPIAAANDRVIAMAMEDAVANDLFAVEIISCQATATES
jgi:hypothetical protein